MLKNFICEPRIGDIVNINGVYEFVNFDNKIGKIVKIVDHESETLETEHYLIDEFDYDFAVDFNEVLYYSDSTPPYDADDILTHTVNGLLNDDSGYFFKIDMNENEDSIIIIEFLYNENDNIITF